MAEIVKNLAEGLRLLDILDVAIVAFIVYRVLTLIKGTRAMQMLTGLGILAIGFYLSSSLQLFTAHWLLSHVFESGIFIIIVLFQDDLRRALAHVGKNPFFGGFNLSEEAQVLIEEIVRATTRLAKEKIGALIVIEREHGLKNFVDTGSQLDSQVRSELIYSIFVPNSPLHDGAIIIKDGRIAAAGCFLPLSKELDIDKQYGSRHRAALGLTEDSDAIVVLVSEEKGEVHLVKNGKITMNLNTTELRQSLLALLEISRGQLGVPSRMRGWVANARNRMKNQG